MHFILFDSGRFLMGNGRLLSIEVHYRRNNECERRGKKKHHTGTNDQKPPSLGARFCNPQPAHPLDSAREKRVRNQLRLCC